MQRRRVRHQGSNEAVTRSAAHRGSLYGHGTAVQTTSDIPCRRLLKMTTESMFGCALDDRLTGAPKGGEIRPELIWKLQALDTPIVGVSGAPRVFCPVSLRRMAHLGPVRSPVHRHAFVQQLSAPKVSYGAAAASGSVAGTQRYSVALGSAAFSLIGRKVFPLSMPPALYCWPRRPPSAGPRCKPQTRTIAPTGTLTFDAFLVPQQQAEPPGLPAGLGVVRRR